MSGGDIYLFKVVIMGEGAVGKSSLIQRLCDGVFNENIPSTGGVADRRKVMDILERKVTLHIWDTAGQEKFRGINRMYYRNAAGAILVFDLTRLETFKKLESWLAEFKEAVSDGELILVGSKLDLIDKREVSEVQAKAFALLHGMSYIETSAKQDESVNEAFATLGENILNKILCNGCTIGPGGQKLNQKPGKKVNGCCK